MLVGMEQGARRRLMPGALGLLTAYVVLAGSAVQQHLLPLDQGLRAWVQPLRTGWLDVTMEAVSIVGEPAGLIPLILIASAVLWRTSRRWALLLPVVMAGSGVLQLAGKWAADRPRPNAGPWGFPSGHVLSLAVFFGVIAFLFVTLSDGRGRPRILACLAGGTSVALVAASRVYLDVHWLSDVLGGFALGTAYLLAALWATQSLSARFARRPAAGAYVADSEETPAA
ncbi:MAG TPA: phosphatase PAP2 family protein [Methylomirabilota bacterium]|nr:phosphatase PAP2 family protein [Methylomirabilota bacterium]